MLYISLFFRDRRLANAHCPGAVLSNVTFGSWQINGNPVLFCSVLFCSVLFCSVLSDYLLRLAPTHVPASSEMRNVLADWKHALRRAGQRRIAPKGVGGREDRRLALLSPTSDNQAEDPATPQAAC